MRKLRVLVLVHADLLPPKSNANTTPEQREEWKTEQHVIRGLRGLGHEVLELGIRDEVLPIRQAVSEFKPHIAFNLLEEIHGNALFDSHVVSYLELMKLAYTGCNPRGMMLARDKALSKKVLAFHRIPVPWFKVFPMRRRFREPRSIKYPVIVKSLVEEASLGIAQASVVDTVVKLRERVQFIHERIGTDAIAEEFIDGRELYVGVLGTARVQVFPAVELHFGDMGDEGKKLYTAKAKWDEQYRKRHRIISRRARLGEEADKTVRHMAKRVYKRLALSGYARLDFRLRPNGEPVLLEANPNPNVSKDDEFAMGARASEIEYPELLQRILRIGYRNTRPGK